MKKLLGTFLLVLTPLFVQAQSAQDELIHVDVKDMRLTVEGYGQANYNVTNTGGEETNKLELSRFMLMLRAQVTPELMLFVMPDLASKTSEKFLHEYWGIYNFNPNLYVKVGQYKTPFSIENEKSPTDMGNIYFHDGVGYMAGIFGDPTYGNLAGRDLGVTIGGSAFPAKDGHKQLGYSVSVFNGSGMNKTENNTQKDYVLRLNYYPIKNFMISTSAYLGTGHALVDDPYGKFSAGSNFSRNRFSVGFEAKLAPLYLRSEYLRGWNAGTPSQCAYAEAWFHVFKKQNIDLILDYEYFDKNIHLNDDANNYMAGVQWWFHKKCRISSLFQFKDPKHGDITRRWVTQLQLRF